MNETDSSVTSPTPASDKSKDDTVVPLDVKSAGRSGRKGRGKQYSNEENISASRAFIRASTNSVNGNDQKFHVFRASVEKNWLLEAKLHRGDGVPANPPGTWEHRTVSSVIQHYKERKKESQKFQGCILKVVAWGPTGGPSEPDILRMDIAVYNREPIGKGLYRCAGDNFKEPEPDFKFKHVYLWLKQQDLMKHISKGVQATSAARAARRSNAVLKPNVFLTMGPEFDAHEASPPVTSGSSANSQNTTPPQPAVPSDAQEDGAESSIVQRPTGNKRQKTTNANAITKRKLADSMEKMAEVTEMQSEIAKEDLNTTKTKLEIIKDRMRQEELRHKDKVGLSEEKIRNKRFDTMFKLAMRADTPTHLREKIMSSNVITDVLGKPEPANDDDSTL